MSSHDGVERVQGGVTQRGRSELSEKRISWSMDGASGSRPSGESPPRETLEGRKHGFQEAILPKSPIPLQKLDDLSRPWSQGRDHLGVSDLGNEV